MKKASGVQQGPQNWTSNCWKPHYELEGFRNESLRKGKITQNLGGLDDLTWRAGVRILEADGASQEENCLSNDLGF